MAEKMTQKEMFAHIMEVCAGDAAIVEFCEGRIAQLSKHRTARKANPEVEARKASVLEAIQTAVAPMTAAQVAERVGITRGQATAALTALVKVGEVVKAPGEKAKDPMVYSAA